MKKKPIDEEQPDPRVVRLINRLYELGNSTNSNPHARAAMAELRRGLAGDPRHQLLVGKYVVPHLGNEIQPDEKWFYLVASLFASHPSVAEKMSLGKAFGRANVEDKSGSTEKRFLNLLAADPLQLPVLLRQAVSFLAVSRRPIGLDWQMLLEHLLAWERRGKPVQHRWAREFYSQSTNFDAADNPNDADDNTNDYDDTEGDTDEN